MQPFHSSRPVVASATLANVRRIALAGAMFAIPMAAQGLCSAALSLSGTGNYIRIPDHPDLQPANAVTYECWFQTNGNSSGRLLSKGDGLSCSSDRTFDLGVWNGMINFGFFLQSPAGRTCFLYTGTTVPPNTWTHVAATFDSARAVVTLFVDGVLVNQQAVPAGSSLFQSTTPFYIGATPPYYNQYFQGQINQVRIWDYAWTPPEAVFRFVETQWLPGTTAQWALDGHLFDLANGHDGQAVGTIGWVGGCATLTNYHAGTAGPFGIPLLTSDPPVIGMPLNVTTDNASNAPALGVLVVGFQPVDQPMLGGRLLADPQFVIGLSIGPSGATLPMTIPLQQSLVGLPLFAQLGALYPNYSQPGLSQGLQWMIGY